MPARHAFVLVVVIVRHVHSPSVKAALRRADEKIGERCRLFRAPSGSRSRLRVEPRSRGARRANLALAAEPASA
jgi:hypothetical protein